jgi:hypothetical protein
LSFGISATLKSRNNRHSIAQQSGEIQHDAVVSLEL